MIRTPFPFHGARSHKCVEREAIGPTSIDLTEAPEEEVEEAEEGNDACKSKPTKTAILKSLLSRT